MTIAAIALFVFSFLAIVALFFLKAWEGRRGHVIAPVLRDEADQRARAFKITLARSRADLSKIPPLANRFAWLMVHEIMLAFASLARTAEREAHRLADLVSQKHRFERRETRSEFLKKVSEGRNTDALDTTGGNGHNI